MSPEAMPESLAQYKARILRNVAGREPLSLLAAAPATLAALLGVPAGTVRWRRSPQGLSPEERTGEGCVAAWCVSRQQSVAVSEEGQPASSTLERVVGSSDSPGCRPHRRVARPMVRRSARFDANQTRR